MLEKLLIRSRAVPSDPPKRRGATSLGPERDRFGLLRAVLSAVPWGQALMGAGIVLLAALVPWGTSEVLSAMDRQVMAIDVKGELVGENRTALERSAGKW
ncbi:MAG: cell division protein FtsQ, partial [Marinobacter sp.]